MPSRAMPMDAFIFEVLHRSCTTVAVMRQALLYICAIREKVLHLAELERQGKGVRGERNEASRIVVSVQLRTQSPPSRPHPPLPPLPLIQTFSFPPDTSSLIPPPPSPAPPTLLCTFCLSVFRSFHIHLLPQHNPSMTSLFLSSPLLYPPSVPSPPPLASPPLSLSAFGPPSSLPLAARADGTPSGPYVTGVIPLPGPTFL